MLENRLLELLEHEPTHVMPLDRLHELVAAEVGPGPAGCARLRRALEARPETFLLIEPASPLDLWSTAEARAAYAHAIEAARLGPSPRVALVIRDQPGSVVRPGGVRRASGRPDETGIELREPRRDARVALDVLDASLLVLWNAAAADAVLRADVAGAIAQADELRRRLGLTGPRAP